MVRLILTRSPEDNRQLASLLSDRAVEVLEYPCVDFTLHPFNGSEVDGRALASFAAVAFTSHRAVAAVASAPEGFRRAGLVLAAVGKRTAAAMERILGRPADLVSEEGTGRDLGEKLAASLPAGSRILHVRGATTTGHLKEALEAAGLALSSLVVYANVAPAMAPLEIEGRSVALFASPSAVRRFCAVNPGMTGRIDAVAIGPTTAACLRESDVHSVAMAHEPTPAALVECVIDLIERWSHE